MVVGCLLGMSCLLFMDLDKVSAVTSASRSPFNTHQRGGLQCESLTAPLHGRWQSPCTGDGMGDGMGDGTALARRRPPRPVFLSCVL